MLRYAYQKHNVGITKETGILRMAISPFEPISQEQLWKSPLVGRWVLVANPDGGYPIAGIARVGAPDMETLNRSENFIRQSPGGFLDFDYISRPFSTSYLKFPSALVLGEVLCGETLNALMGKVGRDVYTVMQCRLALLEGMSDADIGSVLNRHGFSHETKFTKTLEPGISDAVAKIVLEHETGGVVIPQQVFNPELSGIGHVDIDQIEEFDPIGTFDFDFEADRTPEGSFKVDIEKMKVFIWSLKEEVLVADKDVSKWASKTREVGMAELLVCRDRAISEIDAQEESLKGAHVLNEKSIAGALNALASLDQTALRESFSGNIVASLKEALVALRVEETGINAAIAKADEEKKSLVLSFDERIKAAESEHAVASAGLSAASARLSTSKGVLEEIRASLLETLALI